MESTSCILEVVSSRFTIALAKRVCSQWGSHVIMMMMCIAYAHVKQSHVDGQPKCHHEAAVWSVQCGTRLHISTRGLASCAYLWRPGGGSGRPLRARQRPAAAQPRGRAAPSAQAQPWEAVFPAHTGSKVSENWADSAFCLWTPVKSAHDRHVSDSVSHATQSG